MQEKIPFRVHPRAIKELGERLVTDDLVAIAELVKNSYDANAKKVEVRFGEDANGTFIEIEDDGFGMSLEIIKEVWTVLFTPYKKVIAAKKNKSGRTLSGEKGIGRLSAARLGMELEVFTQEKNEKCYRLILEWNDFDELDDPKDYTDLDFDNFGVVVEESFESPFEKNKSGTIIRISNLKRSDWIDNFELFKEVKDELSRIRPPLRKYEDFNIYVFHPKYSNPAQNISNTYSPFLDNPHYFFSGEVDENGNLKAEIKLKKPGQTKSEKFDEPVDDSEEPQLFLCGPFKFEFRVWDLDPDLIEDISTKNEIGKSEVRAQIRINKGVSLYRNEILVLPKTTGNDWLKLETRRVKRVGDKISSANIIAFVDITQEDNPNIRDTADREALQKNMESEQLETYLIKIIERLEIFRKLNKPKKDEVFTFHRLLESEKIESSITMIRDSLESGQPPALVLKKVDALQLEMKKQTETVAERLGYYSRLASVGTIASYMVHEVRNSSTSIFACNRDGRKALEDCEFKDKQTILNRLAVSDLALTSLENLSNAILPLSGSNFSRKSGQTVSAKKVLENCLEANQKMISHAKVSIISDLSDLQIAVSEGELFILFHNLMLNSLYWIGKNKNKKKDQFIQIRSGEKIDQFIPIFFDDSGPGIKDEYLEKIFEPGVSTKPEGTGMGLTVVAEICEKYRGSVSAGESKKLGGASIKLSLPTV